jgi:hypothetical protein
VWYGAGAGDGLRSVGEAYLPLTKSGCSILPTARHLRAGDFLRHALPARASLGQQRSWPVRTGAKHEKRTALWEDTRPQMWCMPDQTITRRGIKEIVAARSQKYYTLPQEVSLYTTALCALWNIPPYQTGVPCGSYVPRGRRVRVRDRYPPPSLTGGRSTTY